MKKILAIAVLGCLLLSVSAFASERPKIDFGERNDALVDYLSQNLTDDMSGDAVDELVAEFNKDHPQFVELSSQIEDNAPATPIETVDVYKNEKEISPLETQGTEFSVTFYDDGSYRIGHLSFTRCQSVDIKEAVVLT